MPQPKNVILSDDSDEGFLSDEVDEKQSFTPQARSIYRDQSENQRSIIPSSSFNHGFGS